MLAPKLLVIIHQSKDQNLLTLGCLDIKFYNQGLNGFEVVDDGSGIKEVDFEIIAKRGTTSKIS